ncbi:uncharacterized protein PV09_04312 [Verruconis gallopava]|uniref:Uncharacterized protein n=1 Tax=Verruconis gallopava TaxID=253628 RepID=A0A0D2ADM8_9PEZI|nr:uncharacterized protein PV09_04312 [Verruconis gallopava]KIW04560.1 hypothetical protein PV09_04312 [Verruconis gallopava]
MRDSNGDGHDFDDGAGEVSDWTPNRKNPSRLDFSNHESGVTSTGLDMRPAISSMFNSPSFSLSSGIDQRAMRTLSIFFHENRRTALITPLESSLTFQLFHSEPAYRDFMSAFITLVHADYEPPEPNAKVYVYQCILNGIKRMREAPHQIDDEAHVRCRALLALLEVVRCHGGRNFLPIAKAAMTLFKEWELDMKNTTPEIALRRRNIIARYIPVLRTVQNHGAEILAIQPPPKKPILPNPPPRPNFQSNFFEFVAGMEMTNLINESYGHSIYEPANRIALSRRLREWYEMFQDATSQPDLLSMDDIAQARLYLAHYIRCTILLDACVMDTETRYSKHDTDFSTLIECIERVLSGDNWQNENMWLGITLNTAPSPEIAREP